MSFLKYDSEPVRCRCVECGKTFNKANAPLIAAAPELLKYVEEFENYLRLANDMPNVQIHLRELIKRAKGAK